MYTFRDFQRMIIFVFVISIKRILWWRRRNNKAEIFLMHIVYSFPFKDLEGQYHENDSDRKVQDQQTYLRQ